MDTLNADGLAAAVAEFVASGAYDPLVVHPTHAEIDAALRDMWHKYPFQPTQMYVNGNWVDCATAATYEPTIADMRSTRGMVAAKSKPIQHGPKRRSKYG